MARDRTGKDWIARYSESHQNPVNRAFHAVGIPLIALSLVASPLAIKKAKLRKPLAGAFAVGWALQFLGHAFEGKLPEFLKDPRFLFVGLRWWLNECRGRASVR